MIRKVVSDYLQGREGAFEVECAFTGKKGLRLMQEESIDLILLDAMLPGMSGFSLLRELRKQKDTPVIMITAKVREEDRLRGYELGCDDYVCKPFLVSELYAKVGAILRRAKGNDVTGKEARRGEESRTGKVTGRGLAIVANVLDRHSWKYKLKYDKEKKTFTCSVKIPAGILF